MPLQPCGVRLVMDLAAFCGHPNICNRRKSARYIHPRSRSRNEGNDQEIGDGARVRQQ